MKIIIADSGSTKTTWTVMTPGREGAEQVLTAGINPFYQKEEEIVGMLEREFPDRPGGGGPLLLWGGLCQ